jgi:hypothetical protein
VRPCERIKRTMRFHGRTAFYFSNQNCSNRSSFFLGPKITYFVSFDSLISLSDEFNKSSYLLISSLSCLFSELLVLFLHCSDNSSVFSLSCVVLIHPGVRFPCGKTLPESIKNMDNLSDRYNFNKY